MAEETKDNLFDFEISGKIRVISLMKTITVSSGVESSIYYFVADKAHELAIYTVAAGAKTPSKRIFAGHNVLEGYVKGKGTLTVEAENGAKETYYFEKEGRVKEVVVRAGQSLHWTAPNDAALVYYELRDRAVRAPAQAPTPVPVEPPRPSGPIVKLLLSSVAISDIQSAELVRLVGKRPREINLALIENAADVEEKTPAWVLQNRQAIQSHGFNVEIIDLKKYKNNAIDLLQKLQKKHVIWLGGGNTFYLRWLLKSTRADEIIKKLAGRGIVYGGSSAGAIVAGPTLKHFETADDPSKAPELILDGLHLTESVVVPHIDNAGYAGIMKDIDQKLLRAHFKTIPLKDNQAVVIEGATQRII